MLNDFFLKISCIYKIFNFANMKHIHKAIKIGKGFQRKNALEFI